MKRLELRIPAKLHEKLRKESFETERSMNEIVNELLKNKYEEENKVLKEKLEELKKMIGEELTLLEMDNEIKKILESESSIFDSLTEDCIADGEYAYTTWADEEQEATVDINIHFEVLEENEDTLEVIVKITDIEEL